MRSRKEQVEWYWHVAVDVIVVVERKKRSEEWENEGESPREMMMQKKGLEEGSREHFEDDDDS